MRVSLALALAAMAVAGCKSKSTAGSGDDAAPVAAGPAGTASGMEPTPVGRGAVETETMPRDDHGHDHAADCPIDDPRNADAALDEAAHRYDRGQFEVALGCTELAVDLIPQAVEAHHLHAAALAALERYPEAQTAFTMAVALDPDDPETLAAAADFYVNVSAPKSRDLTMLGLEYARRGSDKASTRRRRDRELRARLSLLEAQALNDLGRSDEALPRVDDTLRLAPSSIAARYERGVSKFNLCRFDAAYTELATVLAAAPDDPYAHFHIGLIFERNGRGPDAEAHFERARKLAPDDFPAPVLLTEAAFRAELDEAVAELPDDVRAMLGEVPVTVRDLPELDDLAAVDPPFAPTILGLYRGLPIGVDAAAKAGAAADVPPRAIVLYRLNLARAVRTRDELDQQIRKTLLHEIGHLKGLDEGQLRRRGLE
jgi:tetratricopeptide (TPR) repeat protein